MANSKLARQIESRAFNPNYTFPTMTNEASLLELAAPICAFGDPNAGTVDKRLVEYFFGKWNSPLGQLNFPHPFLRLLLSDARQRMKDCRQNLGGLHGKRP